MWIRVSVQVQSKFQSLIPVIDFLGLLIQTEIVLGLKYAHTCSICNSVYVAHGVSRFLDGGKQINTISSNFYFFCHLMLVNVITVKLNQPNLLIQDLGVSFITHVFVHGQLDIWQLRVWGSWHEVSAHEYVHGCFFLTTVLKFRIFSG